MRLLGSISGAVLLLFATECRAAPPIYSVDNPPPRGASRSGFAFRVPQRAPEIDAAEAAKTTASRTYKALVILLQFTDNLADTLGHTPSAFDTLLFSTGEFPTGSMRDYYQEVSDGQFDIEGVVTRWYTAPRPYSYYANNQSGFGGYPQNAQVMAADAVILASAEYDFSQFDNDGPDGIPHSADDDGEIDALFVVHAGPGGEETGLTTDIWSHKWNLKVPIGNHGVVARAYTTEPERWAFSGPYSTAGALISMGVFCHEFGHVLGLPDLYDTSDVPNPSEGIGEWDLMSKGVYTHLAGNALGSTPAHLSAWSKIQLGWVTPTWVLQDSAGVVIPPVETSGRVFRLWTNGADEGEYFLLENRQPIGFDAALVRSSIEPISGSTPSHGLLIYHVDENFVGSGDPSHKSIDVVEAGGQESALGVQNLDLSAGSVGFQTACGITANVTGNRGDRWDPWPGAEGATTFDSNSCPNTASYCAQKNTQVAVQNIAETVNGDITADFFVSGITVRRLAVTMDDTPFDGNSNNGNGLAEPGETIRLHFPLLNTGASPTEPLTGKVSAEAYIGLLFDTINYAAIGAGGTDSGSVIYGVVNPSPDPRGVNFLYTVYSAAGVVDSDSVQVLVGQKSGICDDFEGTTRRWTAIPLGCGGTNQWHREPGVNHTPGGAWAWRLGPVGLIGGYAPSQDARLVTQPIRLTGINDTLTFWQRYDSEFAFDGLTLEASEDNGATWAMLTPVGGYSNGDQWTGFQPAFVQAKVPLTGLSGNVQIAFRFRSQPPNEGLGWWIDDVRVNGTDDCTTTAVQVRRFDATPAPGRHAFLLEWDLAEGIGTTVVIDRSEGFGERQRLATLPWNGASGSYTDEAVVPSVTYRYWLTASRTGDPDAVAGPIEATLPSTTPGSPPRVLAIGRVTPNPFAGSAAFSVSLDRDGPYVVRVYRVDGSLVRTLADSYGHAATYPFTWNGTDDRGTPVGAGVYFFHLRSGNRVRVQRAVLIP